MRRSDENSKYISIIAREYAVKLRHGRTNRNQLNCIVAIRRKFSFNDTQRNCGLCHTTYTFFQLDSFFIIRSLLPDSFELKIISVHENPRTKPDRGDENVHVVRVFPRKRCGGEIFRLNYRGRHSLIYTRDLYLETYANKSSIHNSESS